MRTRRLLSLGRLLACARIFRRPFATHVKLAFPTNDGAPFDLTLKDGTTFGLEQPRRTRPIWDAILHGDARPVRFENGVLAFNFAGKRLHVRPNTIDPEVFREVFVNDSYRLNDAPVLDTVVELGGQVGLFTVRAAALAKRVISLEPHPENRAVAQQNVAASPHAARVALLPLACARRTGEKLQFYMNPANEGASSLLKDLVHEAVKVVGGDVGAIREITVETISLPDLFAQRGIERCSLLKCDIEGGEWEVFAGAADATLSRIDRIEMEIHTQPPRGKADVEALKKRLEAAGFEVGIRDEAGEEGGLWAAMLSAHR